MYTFGSEAELRSWINQFATTEYLAKRLKDPNVRYFFIADKQPIGMSAIAIDGKEVYFSDFYCLIEGSGLGTKLIEHSLAEAKRAGSESVWCEVYQPNIESLRFLEKRGFEQYDEFRSEIFRHWQVLLLRRML